MEEKTQKINHMVDIFSAQMPCIDSSCDNNGCVPYQVGENEWEASQCQYCYEMRFPIIEAFKEAISVLPEHKLKADGVRVKALTKRYLKKLES